MSHLRTAARMFRRGGIPTIVAMLMLAVAIGASTVIFSVVHGVLLRPLPFTSPERLVTLWSRDTTKHVSVVEVSLAELRAWRSQNTTLSGIDVFGSVNWNYRVTAPGEPFTVSYSSVSGTFFDTLGVRAMLGRTLTQSDDVEGAPGRVVLSADLWQRRFSSDRAIVGTTITVGEGAEARPFEIVGVMSPDFRFPAGAELWAAATPDVAEYARKATMGISDWHGLRVFYALGRLKPGIPVEQVAPELTTISRRLEESRGRAAFRGETVVTPLPAHIFGPARPALAAMAAGVAVLLLIACANAAGLLLVQGAARQREIAVRLALGAGRSGVVRQFLWEAGLLAGAAAVLGIALASLMLDAVLALAPGNVPRLDQVSIDATVLLAAAGTAAAVALAVGMLPAWQLSGADFAHALKESSRTGSGPGAGRARRLLVVGQLASAFVLLVAAGLLARSFLGLTRVDLGFDPRGVLTFDLHYPEGSYPTPDRERALVSAVVEQLEELPDTIAAGAIFQRPFEHGPIGMDSGLIKEGQPVSAETVERNPLLNWEAVTPGYFRAMRVRLIRGRAITEQDDERAPLVVLVSEGMAARVWPGQDPIGKRIKAYGAFDTPQWQTVVGVVADARYREVQAPRLDIYVPYRQSPSPVLHFVMRTKGDPSASAAAIRQRLESLDPDLDAERMRTMEEVVAGTIAPWRFNMFVFGVFSAIALGFAAVGLAAVIAYAVRQRRREVGVRVALGARAADVIRLLVADGIRLTAAGLAIGLACSLALTRLLASLLFGVAPTDAATFAGATVLLLAVGFLAAWFPARRAAAVDPVAALRAE